MDVSPTLHDALRHYTQVERKLEEIGRRTDEARKHDLVRCRRLLSEQVGHLGQIIDNDGHLARHPDLQQDLNRLFAAMRYSLAIHQASWPAVRIDEDIIAYRQSAAQVQAKSRAFWGWCRDKLGVDRDRLDS